MSLTIVAAGIAAGVGATFGLRAWRERGRALAERQGLLDDLVPMFAQAQIRPAPDTFPVLTGESAEFGPVRIELICDSLVTRRLPQLWLRLTLPETTPCARPTIGALARPTGAEYYSLVHDMPCWLDPKATGLPLLLRGDERAGPREVEQASQHFRELFADPRIKEAVITPRGVRLIRQVAEGERGAHLLLRQAQFEVLRVAPDLVREMLVQAGALREVFAETAEEQPQRRHAHG